MALQSATSARSTAGAAQPVPVTLNGRTLEANRGIPLNQDWIEKGGVNTLAGEGRAGTHVTGRTHEANRGIPLNQDWIEKVRVNTSAVDRLAATHVTRRTFSIQS